jgi:RHS repeat-associated protein
MEYDSESQLYHTLFRYYNPRLGLWMTPDPAGLLAADGSNPQSLNRYAYVINSPIFLTDRIGLKNDCGGPCTPFSYLGANGCLVSVSYYDVKGEDGNTYDMPQIDYFCSSVGGGAIGGGGSGAGIGGGCGLGQMNLGGFCITAPPLPKTKNCYQPTGVQRALIPIQHTVAGFWNKTVLAGVGASGGVGFGKGWGMYGAGSAQIAVSPSGSTAYVVTFAAPAATTGTGSYLWITPSTKGAGSLAGSQFGYSNAKDPSELAGHGVDASGSLGAGLGIGIDSSISIGGNYPYTTNVTLGFGAGGRGSAGAMTYTTVTPICHN